MITNYFKVESKSSTTFNSNSTFNYNSVKNDSFELHRSFIDKNLFKTILSEINPHLTINSSRQSCVCLSSELKPNFKLYNLPLTNWTTTINSIKNKILSEPMNNKSKIDYGLVHLYKDETSVINWHSDKEALKTNVYSVSIGGTRRFCIRDKFTNEIQTFDLHDGDLFIMKRGCQEKYEHCIKSIKSFNIPRINITFRQLEKYIDTKNTNDDYYFVYNIKEMFIYTSISIPDDVKILTKVKSESNKNVYLCLLSDTHLNSETENKKEENKDNECIRIESKVNSQEE